VVESLLRSSPKVRILVTSREVLAITGEATYSVPPMSPADSVGLFLTRARAVQSDFDDVDSSSLVGEICRQLDGIPLAVELAAARVKILSIEQIHSRLQDRFRLLSSGSRTAPSRHETLRAALDSSYQLLSDDERSLFGRL